MALPNASQVDGILRDDDVVGAIFEFAGLPTPMGQLDTKLPRTLVKELGEPSTAMELALIPNAAFWASLGQLNPKPSGVMQGVCMQALRVARRCVDLDPNSGDIIHRQVSPPPGAFSQAAPAVQGSVAGASPIGSGIKMGSILDDSMDRPVTMLKQEDINVMYADYEKFYGNYPSIEDDPSDVQLSAVASLIADGMIPYTDFSLFGPHNKRLQKKLAFVHQEYSPVHGTWRKQQLAGPPSYAVWWKCYKVLRTVFRLLKAVKMERIDAYADLILKFSEAYGEQCWFIIYQADVAMRSERMSRFKRTCQIHYDSLATQAEKAAYAKKHYDPALPWDGIYFMASDEENSATQAFWNAEVRDKCMMFKTQVQGRDQIMDDGTQFPTLRIPAPLGEQRRPQEGDGQGRGKPVRPNKPNKRRRQAENRAAAGGWVPPGTVQMLALEDAPRPPPPGKANPDAKIKCHKCGKLGHKQADCYSAGGDKKGKGGKGQGGKGQKGSKK